MRIEKIKSAVSTSMALQHNSRERMPENADPEKSILNWNPSGSSEKGMTKFHQMLPAKIRRNAVHAVEVVMTSGAGAFSSRKAWTEYLNACDRWAEGIFGKDNLLHVTHHYDEKTPHTHILFVPRHDGKLNAKHFLGGKKYRMIELQTDFYNQVGKKFGLDRGKPREETKARHTPAALYDLDAQNNQIKIKREILDRVEQNFPAAKKMAAAVAAALQAQRPETPEFDPFWKKFYERLPAFVKKIVDDNREEKKLITPPKISQSIKSSKNKI